YQKCRPFRTDDSCHLPLVIGDPVRWKAPSRGYVCAAKDRHGEASSARMWYSRGTNVIALPLVTATIVALSRQLPGDTTGRINGWAISSFNGHPIAGVMISAPEVHKFVVTDSTGRFALAALPTGRHAIRVSYEGRDTE